MTVWLTAYLANKMNMTEKEVHSMPFYKVLLYSHAFQVLDGAETDWAECDASIPKIELNELNDLIGKL